MRRKWFALLSLALCLTLPGLRALAEETEIAEMAEFDLSAEVAAPQAPDEPSPMAAEAPEAPPAEPAEAPAGEPAEPAETPAGEPAEPAETPAGETAVAAPAGFQTSLTLGVKEQARLDVSQIAGGQGVAFVSSKPKCVSVDEGGLVTARRKGTAVVTVYQGEAELGACTVTVLKAPKKLTFPEKKGVVISRDQCLPFAAILPKGSAGSIAYASDNPAVMTVDAAGNLYGVSGGTATVTATAYNGSRVSCAVHVLGGPAPSTLSLNTTSVGLPVKGTAQLSATFDAGCDAILTYSTSNRKVAAVDENGLVTAKKAGQATITVATHNGLTAACEVQVYVAPKKVTLDAKALTLYVNEGYQLIATLSKNSVSQLTWTSDNPAVASVDENGLVAANAIGQATITVATANGRRASCKVTVEGGGSAPILPAGEYLEIHFISAGSVYDDVIILRDGAGAVLIDGGRERAENHYGRTRVIHEYLRAIGVDHLDYIIGSHLDENHIGAGAWLTDHMPVGAIYYPLDPATCPSTWCEPEARRAALHAAGNTAIRVAKAGETRFSVGNMDVYFIGTREEDFGSTTNSVSIVNLVKYGNHRFLLMGDRTGVKKETILAHMIEDASKFGFSNLKVDMVKWPHHGNTNPESAFWAATDPTYVVVPNNGKRDVPKSKSIRSLRAGAPNAQLLTLSKHRYITLVSDGGSLQVYFDVDPHQWRR